MGEGRELIKIIYNLKTVHLLYIKCSSWTLCMTVRPCCQTILIREPMPHSSAFRSQSGSHRVTNLTYSTIHLNSTCTFMFKWLEAINPTINFLTFIFHSILTSVVDIQDVMEQSNLCDVCTSNMHVTDMYPEQSKDTKYQKDWQIIPKYYMFYFVRQ